MYKYTQDLNLKITPNVYICVCNLEEQFHTPNVYISVCNLEEQHKNIKTLIPHLKSSLNPNKWAHTKIVG